MSTPLPSLRALTAELREKHAAWAHPAAGGEYVELRVQGHEDGHYGHDSEPHWVLLPVGMIEGEGGYGREYVTGDGARFDAVATARRLLAAARDGLAP